MTLLRRLRYCWPWPKRARRQTCEDCWRHFGGGWGGGALDFIVSTAIWNYVMSGGVWQQTVYTVRPDALGRRRPLSEGMGGVVCLRCFDERARVLGVEYRDHVVVFGAGCWMGGTYEDGIPL